MPKYTLDNLPIDYDKYKVIALDLDDTLLRSDKTISQRNIKTLQKAQSQGFSIAITTGRHPHSAVRYMKELGCLNDNSYAVCFNGAGVVRLTDYINYGKNIGFPMIAKETVTGVYLKKLLHFAHENDCKVHTYSVTRGLLVEDHNPYSQKEIDNGNVGFTDVNFEETKDDEEFFKILVVGDPDKLDKLRKIIPQEFLDKFSTQRSHPYFLEFIPNHASKGTALKSLCEKLGYTIDNAIAFGDAENDLAMIKAAGLGVAMENGFDFVKEQADLITLTNDEDGIAAVVEKFLK